MFLENDGPGEITLGTEDRARAVAAVRAVLRGGAADDDELIGVLVETALGLAERFTGRVWIARAMAELIPASAAWQRLGAEPVMAITGASTVADDGGEVALPVDGYGIDLDAEGVGWVRLTAPDPAGRVCVRYECGVADGWDALPPAIAQGAALLAAHLFEAREGDVPPAAVTALWRPWRRPRLDTRRACA